ncbi:hypothetical protein C8N32_11916 [Rhodovulum imhoffii]|uniref:Uncharacterized protein n=1 Tax=Rhodovulum imhoffii TaxID=365340 RepID=A0A2T5BPL9_9RHOB|nr:hypothetical protein [Rhodovulum imhoffii]MBK5932885.1 hypothetical protein [Rhodovulum imhoffii]PTN00959.1 hypothetical protein C8N32_11916 [Rhodovulum imhoffii]
MKTEATEKKQFDGVPPYSVMAFLAYLLILAVLFSDEIVPYCQKNFTQPGNCVPIFHTFFPLMIAAVMVAPALAGAMRWMGGNRTASFLFALAILVLLPLIVGWHYLV